MLFADRKDAGQALARILMELRPPADAVVLALPRGGVPVAFEVAAALHLPLDILAVRKLGAPGEEELAMGAVASGGAFVVNPDVLAALHLSEDSVRALAGGQQAQLEEDERIYRNGLAPVDFTGRPVLLVDDGLATGATMRAAIGAARPRASQIIVAVPLAAPSTMRTLLAETARVVACVQPVPFEAVGRFYRNFDPTSDAEVIALLAEARRSLRALPAA